MSQYAEQKPSFDEDLLLAAFLFLTENDAMMTRFLTDSGAQLNDLKSLFADPDLQASLLDFFLGEEALLTQFCADARISPEEIWRQRRKLPGFATWDSM